METGKKEFVSYEYKTVTADRDRVSFLLDSYENFGWEADGNLYEDFREQGKGGAQKKTTLRLKRNRKIINKMELTRLQRNLRLVWARSRPWKNQSPLWPWSGR